MISSLPEHKMRDQQKKTITELSPHSITYIYFLLRHHLTIATPTDNCVSNKESLISGVSFGMNEII